MLERGIIRRVVDNIPYVDSACTYVAKGDEYVRVFDHLPAVKIDFEDDTWDFSDCFTYGGYTNAKIYFSEIPEGVRLEIKLFALERLDGDRRVKTVQSYVDDLGRILRRAMEDGDTPTLRSLRSRDIINAVEKRYPDDPESQKRLLARLNLFLTFVSVQLDVMLTLNLAEIRIRHIQLKDMLFGYHRVKHSTEISPEKMDEIVTGLDGAMRNTHLRIGTRMAAGIILLQTQTGLRTEEMTALEVDCLKEIECEYGVIRKYIEYNCLKAAMPGQEVIKQKTICTPLAEKTIRYLLELRKKFPHHKYNPFLYLESTICSRNGKAGSLNNLRYNYKRLCYSHLIHIFSKPILGIEQRVYKLDHYYGNGEKRVDHVAAHIPNPYCYRVTFACRLLAQGFDSDFINAIMSHTPWSSVDDAYIQNTRLPKAVMDEIGRLFGNI